MATPQRLRDERQPSSDRCVDDRVRDSNKPLQTSIFHLGNKLSFLPRYLLLRYLSENEKTVQ